MQKSKLQFRIGKFKKKHLLSTLFSRFFYISKLKIKILIFAIFIFTTFTVFTPPVLAAHCNVPFQANGYFFDNFQTAEYINGFLTLHFKLKTPDNTGRVWTRNLSLLSDECANGTTQSFAKNVSISAGTELFSIRFTSQTHFDVWNDETNTKEACANCSQDIPSFPGYYEIIVSGFIDGGASSFRSSAYRININAPGPPVMNSTLPVPQGCASSQSSGYFFDAYERAEYINGLLTYHFRLKTPYNDGRRWYSALRLHDEFCQTQATTNNLRTFNTILTPYNRYYSIRFSTQTHYDIWNDETNQKENCPACSVDIPATLPDGSPYYFISFVGIIDPGFGTFINSTPFRIEVAEPRQNITLSYADEDGFMPDTESPGVHPNKGTASTTPLVFKAVYTGTAAPDEMNVFVGNGSATTSYPMIVDTATASTTLRDNIFTNGEQYTFAQTFPKGDYAYYFETESASTTVRLPAQTDAPSTLTFQTGYSNVAFLPGLEASRLYTREGLFENELWIPNTDNDVDKLALSPVTGESVNPNIYTDDVVDEAYSVNVYKGFLSHMNDMVAGGDIKEFKPLPYDWRMDVRDVVTRVIPLENGGYTMTSHILEMASTSPTGKVTLITHSNGGLVAKELINELGRQGKAHLIDRVIMVAAPELGTPKAILEMLHGIDFFFLNFPSKEVTRELAENMKSGYTLLPSREYFNRADTFTQPLIEFGTTTPTTEELRSIYGESISDYDTLRRFLRGENGVRTEPETNAVNEPNVLREHFLANAEDRHGELDTWTPPEGIDVIEIIGWGLDTPRGVLYEGKRKSVCNEDLSVCQAIDIIDPQPLITSEGDGTVVSVSAEALGKEMYYVEMGKYNKSGIGGSTINRQHKNILEIESLQKLVTTLVKHEATSTLPAFITSSSPAESDPGKRLRVSVHSPVALHLYDEFGRHTGPIPNPDPLSDIELFEEQIPNTYYWQIGEGQYAGGNAASTTTIELNGLALGTFTLRIDEVTGEEITGGILFENIPATENTSAQIQVGGDIITPTLSIDVDGDGVVDVTLTGNEEENTPSSLQVLATVINTINMHKGLKKDLTEKIEQVQKELEKGKKEHAVKKLDDIIKKLKEEMNKNLKREESGDNDKKIKISTQDARALIEIVVNLRQSVVE